jgi:hypothetical protein
LVAKVYFVVTDTAFAYEGWLTVTAAGAFSIKQADRGTPRGRITGRDEEL